MAVRLPLLFLVLLGRASGLRPSGPPPGGRVLPEANPVVPPGCVAPTLAAASGGVPVAQSSDGGWLSEPSPPLRDANGTYHMYATQRKAGGGASMVGAEIVHFQSTSLEQPWSGGEVVLSASATAGGWDSAGVFSPGAAFNAVNGTWALYYSGVSSATSGAWLGLASSASPSGGFVRASGGRAAVRGWSAGGGGANSSAAASAYVYENGARPAGGDLGTRNTTVAGAELHCSTDPMCKGFTFEGSEPNPAGGAKMYFKRMDTVTADTTWQSYTKKEGPVRKRYLLSSVYIYIEMIILPRQARDKHGESTQKRVLRFSQAVRLACTTLLHTPAAACRRSWRGCPSRRRTAWTCRAARRSRRSSSMRCSGGTRGTR